MNDNMSGAYYDYGAMRIVQQAVLNTVLTVG